jgi:hypothetical protein
VLGVIAAVEELVSGLLHLNQLRSCKLGGTRLVLRRHVHPAFQQRNRGSCLCTLAPAYIKLVIVLLTSYIVLHCAPHAIPSSRPELLSRVAV